MSLSALRNFVLPPVIASAAVFSAMSYPLAVLGDKPINIRFEEQPVFDGRVRDIAPPYVVLVTALSVGAGISAAAISGWKSSLNKSAAFESQLLNLEQNLQQKELMLKEMKLSESRLQIAGLNSFLEEEVPFGQAIGRARMTAPLSQPVVTQSPAPVYQPSSQSVANDTLKPISSKMATNNATSAFASAQTFLGYSASEAGSATSVASASTTKSQSKVTSEEFEELQRQLRLMMEQMQKMQNNLPSTSQTLNSQLHSQEKFSVYYDAPKNNEVQFR